MFSERSVAKSPRIVPGAESAGFVAPIIPADAEDRVLTADGEREHGAGRDERDELAEERLSLVLGVVLLRERAGDLEQAGAAQLVAATLEAGDDLAAECATDAVRLDENECGFGSHRRERVVATPPAPPETGPARQLVRRTRSGCSTSSPVTAAGGTGRGAVRAHLPDLLERRAARAARLLEARRADGADEEGCVHLAAADRAMQVALGQPVLEGAVLELAVAALLDRVRRPQEEVDDRADERRHEAEQGRHSDEPGVVDPPPGVLEDPERRRQPEHDDEEPRQVPGER